MQVPATAYVLGNGPSLPVAKLYKLHGALTVGVNRILRSGFDPTVLMFLDDAVWPDERKRMRKSRSLVLGPPGDYGERVVSLPVLRVKWGELPQAVSRQGLCAAPDSVAAAVLWLFALGVQHIQVLGCGGGGDGRSHFYGTHVDEQVAELYRTGLGSTINTLFTWLPLQSMFGTAVEFSDRLVRPVHDVKNKDALRAHLRDVVTGVL